MADWDEIKRLAADFQRAQTSDTLQRLSERNCIDIVKKLTELNLIELIYTCDGKEFITPNHLLREIENEVYSNGGRMQLHDLAAVLKVDYQHVENSAKELVRGDDEMDATIHPDHQSEYCLVLGQIIHSTYKDVLAKQIQECMLMTGQLSIAEFAISLDLPSEFVKDVMPKVSDELVVSQDGRTYYTADMMERYKSIVAGTLTAITKPTTVASLMKRLDLPERIFSPIVDGLIKEGRIDATVENRLFIPAVYAREQNEYINKFYNSNSYIEYDVLSRMDIKQPKVYLKKKFPDGIQLKTCFISPDLKSQVESLVEDTISSNSWIDIASVVPSTLEAGDIELLLQDILGVNLNRTCFIFDGTHVCSVSYITKCKGGFGSAMQIKAQEHLKQGKLIAHFYDGKLKEPPRVSQEKKVEPPHPIDEDELVDQGNLELDEDGKKGSKGRKSGGGSQGREIKQRSTKKKYLPGSRGNQQTSEDNAPSKAPRSNKGRAARRGISPERQSSSSTMTKKKEPLIFLDTDNIAGKIRNESRDVGEGSDEFFESIAKMIENDLNTIYEKLAKQALDEYLKSCTEEQEESAELKEPDNEGQEESSKTEESDQKEGESD